MTPSPPSPTSPTQRTIPLLILGAHNVIEQVPTSKPASNHHSTVLPPTAQRRWRRVVRHRASAHPQPNSAPSDHPLTMGVIVRSHRASKYPPPAQPKHPQTNPSVTGLGVESHRASAHPKPTSQHQLINSLLLPTPLFGEGWGVIEQVPTPSLTQHPQTNPPP